MAIFWYQKLLILSHICRSQTKPALTSYVLDKPSNVQQIV